MRRDLSIILISASIGALLGIFITIALAPDSAKSDPNLVYLSQFTKDKMTDLLKTDFFEHTNSNGCDFDCRTKEQPGPVIGEDLYKGPCSLAMAYAMWLNSPKHKEVLEKGFNQVVIMGEQKEDMCYIVYNSLFNKR